MVKKIIPYLVLIVFGCVAGFPLLHTGLHPTHDGEYHIIRFYEFNKVFLEGNFYPRWAPDLNNGYGVPLFNYVYPLPNYIAVLFNIFTSSFINAFKYQMFLALILSGISMFFWSRMFWGEKAGIVSGIVYMYSPYMFLDIYIRGSVGEVWSLAIFPMFLYFVTKTIKNVSILNIFSSGVVFALLIFSHNILALLFTLFSLTYVIVFLVTNKYYSKIFIVGIIYLLGILLSAIFWLPALVERTFVQGLQIFSINRNFVEIYQLIFPSWGSGFSGEISQNSLSFQIGIANLLIIFVSLSLFLKKFTNKYLYIFSLISLFATVFLMLSYSNYFWETIPLFNYFQFPWRLLSLVIVLCSFIAGAVVYTYKNNFLILLLVSFAFLFGIGYTKPAYYHNRTDAHYITRSNFINSTNSPGNAFNTIWFNSSLSKSEHMVKFSHLKTKLISQDLKSTQYKFQLESPTKGNATLKTAYFPGWVISINNSKENLYKTSDGLSYFNYPNGLTNINVQLVGTTIQKIATFTSLIMGIFIGMYLLIYPIVHYEKQKK